MIQRYSERKDKELSSFRPEFYRSSSFLSVTPLNRVERVYTVSVDDEDHQYVANGFISKNCTALLSIERTREAQEANGLPLRYVAYDIIRYKGESITKKSYEERRKLLAEVHSYIESRNPGKVELNESTNVNKKEYYDKYLQEGGEGCLEASTQVLLADGSQKSIKEIVDNELSVEVISYDAEKRSLVSSLVVGWRELPEVAAREWGYISYEIGKNVAKCLNGVKNNALFLTKNHRFAGLQDGPLSEMTRQSSLTIVEKGLTRWQKEILLGKYLGDGSFCRNLSGHYSPAISHSKVAEDYYNAQLVLFLPFLGGDGTYVSGKGSLMRKSQLYGTKRTFSCFDLGCLSGKKVTLDQLEELGTEKTLAFWLMDDGSYQKNGHGQRGQIRLHTQGFSEEEVEILRQWLFKKFSVKTGRLRDKRVITTGGWCVYMDSENTERFSALAAPYVHTSMAYKLSPEFRDGCGVWWGEEKVFFELGWHVVPVGPFRIGLPQIKHRSGAYRYDIEVEGTNCFVANGILVHNSVLKHRQGPYEEGKRTKHQLKVKKQLELDAVVSGFVPPKAAALKDSGLIGGLKFSVKDINSDEWYEIGSISNMPMEMRQRLSDQNSDGTLKGLKPEAYDEIWEVQGLEWTRNGLLSHMRMIRPRHLPGPDQKSKDECTYDREAVLKQIEEEQTA